MAAALQPIPSRPGRPLVAAMSRRRPQQAVVAGNSHRHHGRMRNYRQPLRVLVDRHTFYLYRGTGKSTLIEAMALQDITRGRCIALIRHRPVVTN